jgi:hypothetical protein
LKVRAVCLSVRVMRLTRGSLVEGVDAREHKVEDDEAKIEKKSRTTRFQSVSNIL